MVSHVAMVAVAMSAGVVGVAMLSLCGLLTYTLVTRHRDQGSRWAPGQGLA